MTLSLRDDPSQQLITAYFPTELADALRVRANRLGWSRAELLRRLAVEYLTSPPERSST
jgi:hypothetical protein